MGELAINHLAKRPQNGRHEGLWGTETATGGRMLGKAEVTRPAAGGLLKKKG